MPDETSRETAREIDSVAADWAARLDRGDLSADEDNALDRWLTGDPRRAGAFAKARAVSLLSEKARALGSGYDPKNFETSRPQKPAMSRRQLLWGGGAAAATVAASVVGYAVVGQGQAYATDRGQMKVVALSDGSVVSLNTASRIRVHYTHSRRTVHLEEGEALFDVAKDAARPFRVLAGNTEVTGGASSFAVRHLADAPVEVIVRTGFVEVVQPAQGNAPVHLDANMRVTAAGADVGHVTPVPVVAPVEAEKAVAWREGRVAFQGETLAKAAHEFERYSDTRIVIDDPSIAREEITGLFQVNDPVGFAHAVASAFGLQVEVREKQVRLYRA